MIERKLTSSNSDSDRNALILLMLLLQSTRQIYALEKQYMAPLVTTTSN